MDEIGALAAAAQAAQTDADKIKDHPGDDYDSWKARQAATPEPTTRIGRWVRKLG